MRKNELQRRVQDLHKRYFLQPWNIFAVLIFNIIVRRLEEQREQRINFERAEVQKLKQRGQPLCVVRAMCCCNIIHAFGRYKKIEAAYEQNVVMPELEHRRQVLKKLRQQFEPIDLKQIAKEWHENHPVETVHKNSKATINTVLNQDVSAFAGMPSVYRYILYFQEIFSAVPLMVIPEARPL